MPEQIHRASIENVRRHRQFRWNRLLTVTLVFGLGPVLSDLGADESKVATRKLEFRPSRLEHFRQWVQAAKAVLHDVHDYECTFVKRERIDGKLQEEHVALMRVRHEPFSVYLKFTAPRSAQGREASFVSGRNQGKMRAKNGGALGLVGFVLIDPLDPRAMQGTRHAVTEAGIANLVAHLEAALARMSMNSDSSPEIHFAEAMWGNLPTLVFQMIDPQAGERDAIGRTLIYFDRTTNLPIRYEAWRREGELEEYFGYENIRFNRGLTDRSFP